MSIAAAMRAPGVTRSRTRATSRTPHPVPLPASGARGRGWGNAQTSRRIALTSAAALPLPACGVRGGRKTSSRVLAVIGRLAGDRDVVHMALAQLRAGDAHEA